MGRTRLVVGNALLRSLRDGWLVSADISLRGAGGTIVLDRSEGHTRPSVHIRFRIVAGHVEHTSQRRRKTENLYVVVG